MFLKKCNSAGKVLRTVGKLSAVIMLAIAGFSSSLADDASRVSGANAVSGGGAISVGGNGGLFSSTLAGGISGEIALSYDVVLTDSDGVPVGTATFKTSKKDKSGNVKVTASIKIASGGKFSVKGTASAASGEVNLVAKGGSRLSATVGADGVSGSFFDGKSSYVFLGARNPFLGRDAASKSRASFLALGCWPVVLKTSDNGGNPYASGFSCFSVVVGKRGSVKVVGTLGNGAKASVSAKAIVGDNGVAMVPVVHSKGDYSFMLRFVGGRLASVSGISLWKGKDKSGRFTAKWDSAAEFSAAPGCGELPGSMYLALDGFDASAGLGGKSVAKTPVGDIVSVRGAAWSGTKDVTDLKASFKKGDGTFKGSFNFYVSDGGKSKKLGASISGVVVKGVPKGTAVVKNVGSFKLTLAGNPGNDGSRGEGQVPGESGVSGTGGETGVSEPPPAEQTKVEIPIGTMSIPPHAFANLGSVKSVTIPASVTEIGDGAFAGCTGITYVAVSGSVLGMGLANVFPDSLGTIEHVTILDGAKSVCDYALDGCRSLKGVSIPRSVVGIGHYAFADCVELQEVVIPEGVTAIGVNAFLNCTKLYGVTLPASLAYIGEFELAPQPIPLLRVASMASSYYGSFKGCTGIRSVTVPHGVLESGLDRIFPDSFEALERIALLNGTERVGYGAFGGCVGLKEVVLPDSIVEIGQEAFSNCTSLERVVIPPGVSKIDYGTFYGCSSLVSVEIPDGVNRISCDAFCGCADELFDETAVEGLKLVDGWVVECDKSVSGELNLSGVRGVANGVFEGCDGISSIAIGKEVRGAGWAFPGGSGMKSFSVDPGNESFSSVSGLLMDKSGKSLLCVPTGLSSLKIPDGVSSIGTDAFRGCCALESLSIPNSVESVEAFAFDGCISLKSAVVTQYILDRNVASIMGRAARTLTNITVSDGVSEIRDRAFAGCYSLESVSIPDSVKSIGFAAFSGCMALTSVDFGDGVESIADLAFGGCFSLTEVSLPESVKFVGNRAFEDLLQCMDSPDSDRDGDGLFDLEEVLIGLNPFNADTDGDGIPDEEEIELGLDPAFSDSDRDGIPDGYERAHMDSGLDPLTYNDVPANEDWDSDGLSNAEERSWNTDPLNADTDGDGIPDYIEILNGADANLKPVVRNRKSEAEKKRVPVTITFGDHTGMKYWVLSCRIQVSPLCGAGDTYSDVSQYGQKETRNVPLEVGQRYILWISWVGTMSHTSSTDHLEFSVKGPGVHVEELCDGLFNEFGIAELSYMVFSISEDAKEPPLSSKEKNDENPSPETSLTPDPINVLTGKVTDRATDLSLPGAALPLDFTRFYVSGRGWRHSFDMRLEFPKNAHPRIVRPDGDIVPFAEEASKANKPEDSAEWKTYRDSDETLTRVFYAAGVVSGGGTPSTSEEPTLVGYSVDMGEGAEAQFDLDGRLTSMSDSQGNEVSLLYEEDRLVSILRNGRVAFSLSYSSAGRLRRVGTLDRSYYAEYEYSASGDLLSASVHAGGSVKTTRYIYGPHGLVSKTNAVGDVTLYEYCDDESSPYLGRATGLVHGDGFYEHEIDYCDSGSTVTFWRDGEPVMHDYASSEDAQRTSSIRIDDQGGAERSASSAVKWYGYDGNNRLVLETCGETRIVDGRTETVYESYTRRYNGSSATAFGWDAYSYNGATSRRNYKWDSEGRHVTAVDTAFGGTNRFEYSSSGQLKAAWQIADGETRGLATFEYGAKGLLVKATNPLGGEHTFCRDADGYPLSETTSDDVTVEYEYDALGHLVAASRGGVELFRRTVDPDGRVTRTDYPDGTYETISYDDMRRPVETTDRAGRVTTLAYSTGNTVTNTTVSYIGVGGTELVRSESVRHDTQLNTREVRNAGRVAVESYVLDSQDRVVAVTNAEGQVARMEYEIGDHVSRMTRFDGTEVGYTQNAYGLLSAAYPTFTNTYSRLMDGSLLSATGPNGTIGYTYDKFGNVTEVATEQGCMTNEYDVAGNVTSRDFGFGSFDCAYDQAGRVTGMTWNVGGLTMPFNYSYSQENGALAAVEYPNDVTCERGYDVMDRLSLIGWSGYDTADKDSREYEYDNADNIVSIATADGATIDYAYDGIDRLAGESKSNAAGETVRTAAFIYDACGNRICNSLTSDGVTEEFANSFIVGDRLAGWTRTGSYTWADSVTNTVYLYAASGCTTGVVSHVADGTVRNVNYAWTDDYRLASVSVDGAAVAEYKYDVFGNLVGVATTDESFEILVDGGHSLADVVVSPGGTKTPLRVYMRGPGVDSWLGFVDMTGATPVPYFYVTDHLGSVLAVVDANGNVVERYEYDAWGKVLSVVDGNGQTHSRSAIGNRILWQGREYSWTTGLYYFRNRWYDPTIGRWISKDPIGIQGGINVYAFCDNNPINRTDPSGLFVGRIVSRKVGWSRVIITDVKGKQVILTNHDLEDFRKTILAYDDQSIADITIYDHGSASKMNIDGDGSGIRLSDSHVICEDENDLFASLVGPKLSSNASIYLSGCNTAREWPWDSENIARSLSIELPGVKVTGNRGVAIGNTLGFFVPLCPLGPTVNWGCKRTYVNGTEK